MPVTSVIISTIDNGHLVNVDHEQNTAHLTTEDLIARLTEIFGVEAVKPCTCPEKAPAIMEEAPNEEAPDAVKEEAPDAVKEEAPERSYPLIVTEAQRIDALRALENLGEEIKKGTRNTTLDKLLGKYTTDQILTALAQKEPPYEPEEEKPPVEEAPATEPVPVTEGTCAMCSDSKEIVPGVECKFCGKDLKPVDLRTLCAALMGQIAEEGDKVKFKAKVQKVVNALGQNTVTSVPEDKVDEVARAIRAPEAKVEAGGDDEW